MPANENENESITADLTENLAFRCNCCVGSTCPTVYLQSKTGTGYGTTELDAISDMEAALAACEWGDGINGSAATITKNCPEGEDEFFAYEATRTLTRFVITGGNTGYVRWAWSIIHSDGLTTIGTETGEGDFSWTPGDDVGEQYVDGPNLDLPEFGVPECDETLTDIYQIIMGTFTCTPPSS